MDNQRDKKRLERRAKSLLVDRDIPPAKMDVVRSLMNNYSLQPNERYSAIIELVQNCPEKPVMSSARGVELKEEKQRGRRTEKDASESQPRVTAITPTETSYYVDEIFRKYRPYGLIKKRYLVRRQNRLGFWFRKRLIPAKKLFKAFKLIDAHHKELYNGINRIMSELLDDSTEVRPDLYNYLNQFKRLSAGLPLTGYTFDATKWMEREHFEKEIKSWITGMFGLLALSLDEKQMIYSGIERRLTIKMSQGAEANSSISENQRFLFLVRSFMPLTASEDTLLSRKLKTGFGIDFFALIIMMAESFVFQRPVSREDIVLYYSINAPAVNSEKWDCGEEMLKRAGKDMGSILQREIDRLVEQEKDSEQLIRVVDYSRQGGSLLISAADEQWKQVDKKNYDPVYIYEENFLVFLDALINYFNGTYLYYLSGSSIRLQNYDGKSFEYPVFDPGWFVSYRGEFTALLNEIHLFRTNNPSLVLTRKEIKRIAGGQIPSMNNVLGFLGRVGGFFFHLGSDLVEILKIFHSLSHETGSLFDKPEGMTSVNGRRLPIEEAVVRSSVEEIDSKALLLKRFKGMRVIASNGETEGLIDEAAAFCCQISIECRNEGILSLLHDQKTLSLRIAEIEKKIDKLYK